MFNLKRSGVVAILLVALILLVGCHAQFAGVHDTISENLYTGVVKNLSDQTLEIQISGTVNSWFILDVGQYKTLVLPAGSYVFTSRDEKGKVYSKSSLYINRQPSDCYVDQTVIGAPAPQGEGIVIDWYYPVYKR